MNSFRYKQTQIETAMYTVKAELSAMSRVMFNTNGNAKNRIYQNLPLRFQSPVSEVFLSRNPPR